MIPGLPDLPLQNGELQPIEVLLSADGMAPNRGHAVIAAMEQSFERVWVLTQKVDAFISGPDRDM